MQGKIIQSMQRESGTNPVILLDELDKEWAKEHLSIEGSDVIITKDDGSTVKIFIETPQERAFLKTFFGI